jgi:hypothetical protein
MGKAIHAAGLLQTRVWDYAARKRHQHVAIQPSCMCWILSRIKSLLVPVCPCQSRSVVILLRHAGVIRPNLARCKVSKNLRLFRACFASLLCELFWFFILLWNVFFLTAPLQITYVTWATQMPKSQCFWWFNGSILIWFCTQMAIQRPKILDSEVRTTMSWSFQVPKWLHPQSCWSGCWTHYPQTSRSSYDQHVTTIAPSPKHPKPEKFMVASCNLLHSYWKLPYL